MRVIDYATYKRTGQIVERLPRWVPPEHYDVRVAFARLVERRMHEMESVMAVDRPSDTE